MSRRQLGLRITIPATILTIAGIALYSYLSAGAEAPVVTTAIVAHGDIVRSIATTGTLEAVQTVTVGSQVSGTVSELHADFNDIVHKGQVLARLDPSSLQSTVNSARASLVKAQAQVSQSQVTLENARVTLGRQTALAKRTLIAPADLDAAQIDVRSAEADLKSTEAQVTQARASLSQAEVNLGYATITSPIDGIIINRNVDVGQTVAASMSAPTLYSVAADLTRMRVNAKIDESDIGVVKEGMPVTFRVDAYPTDTFVGRVVQVRLLAETTSNVVTYATVISVQNDELKLKPGMTANVTIQVAKRANVLRVPAIALRFKPTQEQLVSLGLARDAAKELAARKVATDQVVWRRKDSGVERVVVQVGLTDGSTTEITGGLQAEDHVITNIGAAVKAVVKASATPR
jgi:HlyD family secretion protein